jgi:hypothetical protein
MWILPGNSAPSGGRLRRSQGEHEPEGDAAATQSREEPRGSGIIAQEPGRRFPTQISAQLAARGRIWGSSNEILGLGVSPLFLPGRTRPQRKTRGLIEAAALPFLGTNRQSPGTGMVSDNSLIPISDEQAKLGQEALKVLRGLGSFLEKVLGSVPEDLSGVIPCAPPKQRVCAPFG